MELTGTIIAELPMVQGTGKNNKEWFKQDYILEIPSQYPKKVCFSLWNDNIDKYNLRVNDSVTAHIDIESREYNGRWFTEVKAWKVDKVGSSSAPTSTRQTQRDQPPVTTFTEDESDDLPF